MSRYASDVAERVLWTTVQFVAGLLITETTPLQTWWAAPIGVGLALVKAFAAKNIGQKNTASTLSQGADPAGNGTRIASPHAL